MVDALVIAELAPVLEFITPLHTSRCFFFNDSIKKPNTELDSAAPFSLSEETTFTKNCTHFNRTLLKSLEPTESRGGKSLTLRTRYTDSHNSIY